MINNSLKITEIWRLLRSKEKENGLNQLSLTERDIFENLAYLMGNNKQLPLEAILIDNSHPRATFFRSLKKLRDTNYVKVFKENKDKRKSIIYLSKELKA